MNYSIPFLPERSDKPRKKGITMVMDKGLSIQEAKNFIQSSQQYADFVKFGFGTSLITNGLKEKIELYKSAGLNPYFGGTLFELFYIRGRLDEYLDFSLESGVEYVEVSDGSISMDHEEKLKCIEKLAEHFTVFSEVGSKQKDVVIEDKNWVSMMKKELSAGAWKVIAEARESGTIGIYDSNGKANEALIELISENLNPDDILWEAPVKAQQVYFIQLFGTDVNLGNIAINEVVALESLRLGLRGDTFFQFLPEDLRKGN